MIHIAILTYNRLQKLQRLLNALLPIDRTVTDFVCVHVFDQGSSDGTEAWCRTALSTAQYSHAASNWGVAGGRQRLVDKIGKNFQLRDFDVIIFLDDDIVAPSDDQWIHEFIRPIRRNEADIVGVEGWRVLPSGLTQRDDSEPHYVSGGWCAIAGCVFNAGIEFDPRFNPSYFEDVDLCLQARARGFKIAVAPNVGLTHDPDAISSAKIDVFEHSRRAFVEKWKLLP